MATPENLNTKPGAPQSQTQNQTSPSKKPNFSGYLRAVDPERLNVANNPEKPLVRSRRSYASHDAFNARLLQITGIVISAIWLAGAAAYIQRSVGWNNVSGLLPHEMGGFLAGILSPIALFWMIAAFIMRSNDVKKYAEALREEIQVMIFPSDEADRRVNNDIERLMKQTSEMSKATRLALAAIESAREGLRTQVSVLNDSSELTVDRLDALSQALNARMKDATDVGQKLDATLQGMEERTQIAASRMDSSREQLDQAIARIDQSSDTAQQKIASVTTSSEISVARLSEMLKDRLDALGSLHQETETALQNASEELAAQRKDLRIEAEAIEEKAYGIADALQKGAIRLYEFSDDALDKAKLVETRLQGQAASLQQILAQSAESAENIEKTTSEAVARLQDTTGKALTDMHNVTEKTVTELQAVTEKTITDSQQIESILQNAISRLAERTQANVDHAEKSIGQAATHLLGEVEQISERAKAMTDTMLAEVNKKVMDTTSAFAYIQKQIQALVTLFDQRKLHLDDASMSARETAATMNQTLQLALNKVAETTDALQKGVGNIHVALQQPISLLENVATMAYKRADDIGELLQNKANSLTDIAGKMGDHVIGIQNQLHTRGQDVALIAGKIASHLKSVTEQLESQNTLLDGRVARSVENLEGMSRANQALVDDIGKLQEQSSMSAETIQQRVSLLQQLQQALAADSEASQEKMSRVAERIVTVSSDTVSKVTNTIENMTLLEADYHRLSDAGLEDIQRLESGYRQLLDNVRTDVGQTNQSLEQHLTTIQETADGFVRAGETINVQASRIQDLGQTATTTLQQAITLSGDFSARVKDSNNTISIHIDTLQDVMSQIQSNTLHAVEALVQQEQSLEQQVQTQVAKLSEANQHFVSEALQIRSGLDAAVESTETLADRVRDALGQLRDQSASTESALGQSVSRLISYNEEIDNSTSRLLDRIDQVNQDLKQQSREIQVSNDDVMSRLQDATRHISNNAAALEAAAKAAQQQAEALRAQESKLNRDAFFNSTKFVVESLHSLALDFTRMLDGELDDKVWKSYQKGDVAAFTRRLLNARDAETQAKIEAKFKDDVEFRTYVQRYLRQFEEIFDSASQNDHADLLLSIFSTSDVGKLYHFLCATVDREPRGARKAA